MRATLKTGFLTPATDRSVRRSRLTKETYLDAKKFRNVLNTRIMNLRRVLSLSWKSSPALHRLFWSFVFLIHLVESMVAACIGMSDGPSPVQFDMVWTAVLFFFATHLMVHTGVKRWVSASRPVQDPMTTAIAENFLGGFTGFRGPLAAAWVHRHAHVGAIILVACAYVLFTVRDLTGWPDALLIGIALLLSVLNTYLILLIAINYIWGGILKGLQATTTTRNP
jgi:hypothetical protein